MVSGWSAYYSNGNIYSSRNTTISALPEIGMLVWMIYFENGTRRVLHGNDIYFWFDDGSKDGVFGQTDDVDDLDRYSGAKIIKGVLVDDVEMHEVIKKAFRTKQP